MIRILSTLLILALSPGLYVTLRQDSTDVTRQGSASELRHSTKDDEAEDADEDNNEEDDDNKDEDEETPTNDEPDAGIEEESDDESATASNDEPDTEIQVESNDEGAPDSFLGDGMGIELVSDDDEGTTIFRADEASDIVQTAIEENPDAGVKSVLEIRTKLKFRSNRETLANPELVERIVADIKEQQEQLPGLSFVFCLHVGTTQLDRILQTRPGFMEGRVTSVKEALQPAGEIPGVSGTIAADFMHFESTRFAGLVMWAYAGETAPECAKEDLKPPA